MTLSFNAFVPYWIMGGKPITRPASGEIEISCQTEPTTWKLGFPKGWRMMRTSEETHNGSKVRSMAFFDEDEIMEAVPVFVFDPTGQSDVPPVWVLVVCGDMGTSSHGSIDEKQQ